LEKKKSNFGKKINKKNKKKEVGKKNKKCKKKKKKKEECTVNYITVVIHGAFECGNTIISTHSLILCIIMVNC
jgi:hypothetical protein